MKFKPSRYNIISNENKNHTYIANTFTGQIIKLNNTNSNSILSLFDKGFDNDSNNVSLNKLVNLGFFVEKDTNELFRARHLHEIRGRDNRRLQLIVLATEQCNFRCTYCYENFQKGVITEETIIGIKKYLDKNIRYLNHLNIQWFGGEPLLAIKQIEEISRYAINLCDHYNVTYTSSMTTNGYLLNEKNISLLDSLKVKRYQITLDGNSETHNKSRVLRNGSGSYDKIFNNLKTLKNTSIDFTCRIRVNFDKDNYESLYEFTDLLSKYFSKDNRFEVDYFPVGKWGGNNDENLNTLNSEDSSNVRLDLCQKATRSNLKNVKDSILKPGGQVCYAADPNSFVIGSDGIIYKCTVVLYKEFNQIGKLMPSGEMVINQDKHNLWILNDEDNDSGCMTCQLRPSCQGSSCPLVRIETGNRPCPPDKKNIKKIIQIVAENKDMVKRYEKKSL